jgi:hypothetical protein
MKECTDAIFYSNTVSNNWECHAIPGGSGVQEIQFSYVPPYGGGDCFTGGTQYKREFYVKFSKKTRNALKFSILLVCENKNVLNRKEHFE